MSVASGIHVAAFDARSRCSDVGEHAADLRDAMVQTQDTHEANSSLTDLILYSNKVSDEGAIALAQAMKATLVVCSEVFLWPLCRHSRSSAQTASLA